MSTLALSGEAGCEVWLESCKGIALVLTLELEKWVDEDAPGTRDTLRNATIFIIATCLPHELSTVLQA